VPKSSCENWGIKILFKKKKNPPSVGGGWAVI
jgi:hypothetical protein